MKPLWFQLPPSQLPIFLISFSALGILRIVTCNKGLDCWSGSVITSPCLEWGTELEIVTVQWTQFRTHPYGNDSAARGLQFDLIVTWSSFATILQIISRHFAVIGNIVRLSFDCNPLQPLGSRPAVSLILPHDCSSTACADNGKSATL